MPNTLARKGRPTRTAAALVIVLAALLMPGGTGTPANAADLPPKSVWLRDVKKAMAGSSAYLDQRVEQRGKGETLAIVLDIDNTAMATAYAWPRPTKAVRAFAQRAVAKNVRVWFVTGRTKSQLGNVRSVLTRAGYRYVGICTRKTGESLSTGKQRCRRSITAKGYTITASVGNRNTDFTGGNYERKFKLPSYNKALS